MKRWRKNVWSVAGLAFVSVVLGCGEGRSVVKGRITFDGKAIEKGAISFEPADGQGQTSGAEIKNGNYELTGRATLSPGMKIVRIRASRKTGRKVPIMPGSSQLMDEVQEFIPINFNTKSTLKREVVAGKINEFDFDLKPP